MGKILNRKNLRSYLKKPPFNVAAILYDRLPVLAVRNYLNDYPDEDEWPLVWKRGRSMRVALSVTMDVLKGWQAFRPGSAAACETRLRKCVPGTVRRVQSRLRSLGAYRVSDVTRQSAPKVLAEMVRAVAEVSSCKPGGKANPMLGSKVMSFFFPEFFPVWDTAWVKRKVFGKLSRAERKQLEDAVVDKSPEGASSKAVLQYSMYVNLMFADLRQTSKKDYEALRAMCLRRCARENSHTLLESVMKDNVWDLSPLLFELCLLGDGVKAVRAALG